MKIVIHNKRLLLLIFFLFFLTIVAGVSSYNHIQFVLLTIELFIVIYVARYSYFSVFTFILWFSYLQEYFASIDLMLSSGRLKWDTSIPIYYQELFICTSSFIIIELLVFACTDVIQSEKKLYSRKISISTNVAKIYAFLSFFLIFLAYPNIPTIDSLLARDQGFISSSLIVPIAFLLLATTFDKFRESNIIKIVTVTNIIWVLLHGDRVIVIGFVIYIFLKYINSDSNNISAFTLYFINKKKIVVIIASLLLLILSIRIQNTRIGQEYSFSINSFIFNLLKQGTAADIVHVFNCSVYMWKSGEGLYGYTYLSYLDNLFPSSDIKYSPSLILMNKYNTLGGGLFFAEPMMNGGIVMCVLHSTIFIVLLSWVFKKCTNYRTFLIIPFYILIFRFAWYASLAGLVKMTLYYVPVLYYFSRKFK